MVRNIYERYGEALAEIERLRAALKDDFSYLRDHRTQLENMIDQRDKFIKEKGLWAEFIYSLKLGDSGP